MSMIATDGPSAIDPSLGGLSEPIPHTPPIRFSARGTPLSDAEKERPRFDPARAASRMARARDALTVASDRQAAVSALVEAASVVTPRIGLFRVRDAIVSGLPTVAPSSLPDVSGLTFSAAPGTLFAEALAQHVWAGEAADEELQRAFEAEGPIPCLLGRVDVAGRPLMLVYADHAGDEFVPGEAKLLEELCREAGQAFEAILKARSGTVRPLDLSKSRRSTSGSSTSVAPPPDYGTSKERGESVRRISAGSSPSRSTAAAGSAATAAASPARGVPLATPDAELGQPRPEPQSWDTAAAVTPQFVPPPLDELENSGVIELASPAAREGPVPRRLELADSEPPMRQRQVDAAITAVCNGEQDVTILEAHGKLALDRVAELFPGSLDVLRRDLRALPPPSAHGGLVRVSIALGARFVPHLIASFDSADVEKRFYAAFVFQELRDDACVLPLSQLSFDSSGDVRVIAMRVLETYSRSPEFEIAVETVRQELASPDRTRRLYATRAVGTLRDVASITSLIGLLSSKDRFTQEAALESLCSITGQQHGLKPHRWRTWHAEHQAQHRIEWIIHSLRHRDLPVRRWAHDELIRVTGHRVPFSPLGDRQSRDVAARAWTDWWMTTGRYRFGGTRPG